MGKETRPTISVVISTFNRSDRLKKAIQSVLAQTFEDFELIIVDDASKDNTQAVIQSFKDPRIRYLRRKKNFGNDTRPKNEGIMASKGQYIAFLDDDNTYRLEHLAILYRKLTKNKHLDVVYGDRWIIDETKVLKPQLGIASHFDAGRIMEHNFIDTSDVLIKRRALFDVGGFDERYKKYIDWNLWVRMAKYGTLSKRVPMVITDYHIHNAMKSLTVKDRQPDGSASVPLGAALAVRPEWNPIEVDVELPYLGNHVRVPRVAVFTLTYDRLQYTKASFKSLQKTAGYSYDHFVVDNGSTDGTIEWLKENIDSDKLVLNGKNLGISKASNQIISLIKEAGGYDCILKWDNDCIGLTKGWLAKMVDIWKSNHMFSLSCYVQGLVDYPGGATRLGFGTVRGELLGITKHLGGICHFADARVYDEFQWDNESFLHGVQDMEMSQYLLYHGYRLAYLENYFVSHGPLGTEQQRKEYPGYFERQKKEKQTRYAEDK